MAVLGKFSKGIVVPEEDQTQSKRPIKNLILHSILNNNIPLQLAASKINKSIECHALFHKKAELGTTKILP